MSLTWRPEAEAAALCYATGPSLWSETAGSLAEPFPTTGETGGEHRITQLHSVPVWVITAVLTAGGHGPEQSLSRQDCSFEFAQEPSVLKPVAE